MVVSHNRGEANPRAKLSAADVAEIRRLRATGEFSMQALADRYSVVRQTISRICRGGWDTEVMDTFRGGYYSQRKLSAEQVAELRAGYAEGEILSVLGERFDISQSAAERIAHGDIYSDLPDAQPYRVKGLTRKQALVVRRRYFKTKVTQQQLADEYGVTLGCINLIINNKTHIGKPRAAAGTRCQ